MNRIYIDDTGSAYVVLGSDDILDAAKSMWNMMQTMRTNSKIDFATDLEIDEDETHISVSEWFGVKRIDMKDFDCGKTWLFAHYGGGDVVAFNKEDYEDDGDMVGKIVEYFVDKKIGEVAVEIPAIDAKK